MVTVKDLAKKLEEKKLVPGHRTCAGCAAPIIVRAVLAASKRPVVAACATGCLEVGTTIYPFTSWNVPFIHNAFENVSATISGVETAYKALKKKGRISEDINFVAFGGDGGTYDIGLQSLSGALERGHRFVYVLYDNEAYMNCLSLDSFIMAKDGLKRITEIKVGDFVYAFNQKNAELALKRCSGVFDNGVKKVFELNTMHHTIKATSNHPFLTVKRDGGGKDISLVWKTLGNLKKDDEVIVLKRLKGEMSFKFKEISISEKGDYKANKINKIKLPKQTSPELMELLGIYTSDGWTKIGQGQVGFALPKNSEGRERLMGLCKELWGTILIHDDKNYAYVYSRNLARLIDSLGFGMGSKSKVIPGWVFTLPENEKEAFLRGLMRSDGCSIRGSHRYVSASIDLLRSLRLLLQTMGFKVGKIHQRANKKGTFVVYRQLLEDSGYGYICFSKKRMPGTKKDLSQSKRRDFLADNEFFSTEKIKSINYVKEEPTLDLRVEGEHNFIADGIVVHNTGVQRSSATPYGASTTTMPAGKVIQGKLEWKKDITAIAVAHKIPYVAQASVSNLIDLFNKAEKAFNASGPAFINVLQPCTTGWGYPPEKSIEYAKLAVETKFWPLYEVENGVYKLSYRPAKDLRVADFMKGQVRFKHLFNENNAAILGKIQKNVDDEWGRLLKLCGEGERQ